MAELDTTWRPGYTPSFDKTTTNGHSTPDGGWHTGTSIDCPYCPRPAYPEHRVIQPPFSYCPHCGAKL